MMDELWLDSLNDFRIDKTLEFCILIACGTFFQRRGAKICGQMQSGFKKFKVLQYGEKMAKLLKLY
jgi:hypothetical protein